MAKEIQIDHTDVLVGYVTAKEATNHKIKYADRTILPSGSTILANIP